MTAASKLRRFAQEMLDECSGFSYARRIEIERTLFRIAKEFSWDSLGIELHNFGMSSRDAVVAQCEMAAIRDSTVEYDAILEVFQLAAALGSLASGEPYRTWELAGPSLASRKDAMRLFSKRLCRLADLLHDRAHTA